MEVMVSAFRESRDRQDVAARQVAQATEALHALLDEDIDRMRLAGDAELAEALATMKRRSIEAEMRDDLDRALTASRWAVLITALQVARLSARLP